MFKAAKVSALMFVILVAGCASPQPPRSAVDAPDKPRHDASGSQSESVVYDY